MFFFEKSIFISLYPQIHSLDSSQELAQIVTQHICFEQAKGFRLTIRAQQALFLVSGLTHSWIPYKHFDSGLQGNVFFILMLLVK